MEFFVYHRDRVGSLALRQALLEDHWSYMDGFAAELIARGPVFEADGESLRGSVHIAELPDPAAAWAFACEEPGYQAGAYRDVMVRRWRNELGRTMWDFAGGLTGEDRYLVLGLGPEAGARYAVPAEREELLAFGPLLSDDGETWLGTAALVRAPDAEAARGVLGAGPWAQVEVHPWECGGRR
ncbi:YciI family protein [Streptomyces xanthii]|uniref:YCII-related domain-containing protein n=1 Tax=Streptomyces xanthii TaxID=2768069 RepID=A0A7H1BH91_9ACTN|nr:YciI family protein [Streptomyces xanthii]QNS08096.1 hypothetical protein IAG42_33775 [Streptomyces xanthii]